ncbi:MAG: IMP dehydrogenase [Kiritimatiellia bacterium]|jgi:IMP dehydrogenase
MLQDDLPFALTFDDVLLVPRASEVLPAQVDVSTRLAPGLTLNVPILSAAMDTVSEGRMGIGMAQQGGLAILHKNMSIQAQAAEVRKVKRAMTGVIEDPISVQPDITLGQARTLMRKHDISGLPVVENGRVVGIITNRDLRFERDTSRVVRDVMSTDLVTVAPGTGPERAKDLMQQHKIEKLLVVGPGDVLQGLITIKDVENLRRYPQSVRDPRSRLRCGAAVGPGGDRQRRLEALVQAGVDVIVIDTAHGHHRDVLNAASVVKAKYPDLILIVGNVATAAATRDCINAGADVVKVGIGPGSICTTRIVAGVGVPQLSAVSWCGTQAHDMGKTIIADGGIKYSGDMAKALAAGADAVMMGSMFAGTDEAPGETVLFQGRRFKAYRGMGSIEAMRAGSSDRYFQDEASGGEPMINRKLVPEGIVGRVAYKGPVADVVYQLVGGLRASMGYCGAPDIQAMQQRSHFVRITGAGLRESHVHDVVITEEAPNYRRTT